MGGDVPTGSSQAISVWFTRSGGLLLLVQSKLASAVCSCCCCAVVSLSYSASLFGIANLSPFSGSSDFVVLVLVDGVAELDVDAAGVNGTAGMTTGRKFNFAACPRSCRSVTFLPGIETTIWFDPWMTTSALATPEPLTRCSMMSLASFIDDLGGVGPLA